MAKYLNKQHENRPDKTSQISINRIVSKNHSKTLQKSPCDRGLGF